MSQISIDELQQFFSSVEIPHTIQINRAIKWSNVPEHVAYYITRLKSEPMATFTTEPLLIRLLELKDLLTEK